MKISIKKKAHRKDCTLTMSNLNNLNLIIEHSASFVKYYRKPRASPITNFDIIKSFTVQQLAFFLMNFGMISGDIGSVKKAEEFLRSKANI